MNEKEYPLLYKTVGAFDIFKGQYYTGSYVRALADKDDHDRVQAISHLLLDLNDTAFRQYTTEVRYHAIRRRNISDKRAKRSFYEIALETCLKPSEVETWLANNGNVISVIAPTKEEFSVERLSVGPCRYQDKETQYVKIRFDGYSVPLHFSAGLGSGALEGRWDEAETARGIKQELPNDPGTVEEIMNMFKSGNTVSALVERALTRPMNKSCIVESGSFSPTFFVPVTYNNISVYGLDNSGWQGQKIPTFEGYKAVKEKNELATPDLLPVAVFSFTCQPTKDMYGYNRHKSLLVVVAPDDQVYTVSRVYNWYGQGTNRQLSASDDVRWLGAEAVIRKSELKVLDEQDAFVRERAGRALSRKL